MSGFIGGGDTNMVVRLATVTGVNMKTEAATALYTVPTGKKAVITDVILEATNISTLTNPAAFGIGVTPSFNEWIVLGIAEYSVFATGEFQSLISLPNATDAAQNIFSAADVVSINVTTGADATTYTAAFHVLGFLLDA